LPLLETFHKEWKDRGLVVVAIQGGRWARNRLRAHKEHFGITFPLLYDGPPYAYGAYGSPTIVILNKQGMPVAYRRGECSLTSGAVLQLYEHLLAEPFRGDATTSSSR